MNWAYFHLVINHFPIIGVIIGTLLLVAGMVFNNQGVKISGLGTVAFSAIMSILAYVTGNPAEEVVRAMPDAAGSLISRHEGLASIGMYLIITAGLMAGVSLYSIWKKEKSVRFLLIITLVLALISSGAMVYIGRTGGQIRHSEFRDAATKQYMIDHKNDVEDDD